MKFGIKTTRWMMKMMIMFQLIRFSINLTIKTTSLNHPSNQDQRKLSKRDMVYRNLEAVNNLDDKIIQMILNGIIQHFMTSDPEIGNKRMNGYDFIHSSHHDSSSSQSHQEEKVIVPYLGRNSKGETVNRPKEVMIKWATAQDQSDWNTLGFDLEHVLMVSRILGLDGEFININLEGQEWYRYILKCMFELRKEEFKFFEILSWFSTHLNQEEFLKRFEIFSYITSKGLNPSSTHHYHHSLKNLKPWWNKLQIERWIKRSDWDVNLILKVGDLLKLNEPNVSFQSYNKRSQIREKLMNFLDPTSSSKLIFKSKDEDGDEDEVFSKIKKMSTYLPEALSIETESSLVGSLYKKRINLLTEVRRLDGSLGRPEPNHRFFRIYWITRGVDPEIALKSLNSNEEISEPGYVIFNQFNQSFHLSKYFEFMNLVWAGFNSVHEVLHQVWERAIQLRPAW
ncbi:uncharacterized protein MELLADRAFT_108074 [Melampsora larici-populina 98AG31]|uniref:Secreted protein n=1 Tax=Melampsora larici-populina (strain 98AG31 / pathotype 3-4-7) TaxID=747676 RepID=F4RRV9_MELLP|nr:uncharacterized protein MELLADRAFT_108074 [Melampsora larici-populina 98AG31]EGG04883.1 hypothetical protein MELLADRAFT_108074 [Melampsora larici-populina 98AG31]